MYDVKSLHKSGYIAPVFGNCTILKPYYYYYYFFFFFFDTLLTSETVLLGLSQRLPFGLFLLMPASGCGTDLPLVQSRSFFPPHRESWGHSASVPDLSMVLILENFPGIMYFPTKSLRSSPGLWTSCPSPAWLRRTHN